MLGERCVPSRAGNISVARELLLGAWADGEIR